MSECSLDLESVRESVGVSSERLERAFTIIDGWVAQGKVPGVAALVVRRGRVVARHFRGLAAPGDASRPLNADTIFPLSSLTKPLTTIALLTLVESGDVMLEDPVSLYIPEFGKNGKEGMRVRHLLTHTCGLPDMPPNNDALRKAHSGLASFVRATTRADLAFTPGTRVAYCSMGTLILGEIVERVTKQPLADYAAERVFRPLGMTQTFLRPPEELYPRIAVLRLPEGRKAVNWDNNSPYWRQLGAPWGGLFATADDLARFAAHFVALVTGGATEYPVLGPTTARLMIQNHTRGIPSLAGGNESWGFGWALPVGLPFRFAGDLTSPETFGHHGASGSLIWADPTRDLACVVLTNQMTNWGTEIRRYGAFSNALVASIVR